MTVTAPTRIVAFMGMRPGPRPCVREEHDRLAALKFERIGVRPVPLAVPLAGHATRLVAARLPHDVAHHAAEPAARVAHGLRRPLEHLGPGLLHRVVDPIRVSDQRLRDSPHPAGLGQEHVETDRRDRVSHG